MKRIISLSVLLLVISLCIGCSEKTKPQLTEDVKSGLRRDAKEFTDSLKAILIKEMQANEIVKAISVCSDTAQLLTVNYGFSKGIYIKRVSLKNRNPLNAPDGFESKVLNYFEQINYQGRLADTSEFFELINIDGVRSVRYMKPIILQAPCLSCHGAVENIGDDVRTIINDRYPDDKATGYMLDDLRGAVSIQKTL